MRRLWFSSAGGKTADLKKRSASSKKVNIQNNAYHKQGKQRFSKNSHDQLGYLIPYCQLLARLRVEIHFARVLRAVP